MRLTERKVTETLYRCTQCGEYATVIPRKGKAPYFSRHGYLPAGAEDVFYNYVQCTSQNYDSTDTKTREATYGSLRLY